MINSITNQLVGVTFYIQPQNAGHIQCNNENIATNQYIRSGFDTKCTAISNNGFEFSNWVENLGKDSTRTISAAVNPNLWYTPLINWFESFADILGFKTVNSDSATFTVTQYGNFTANFEEVPPPLPPEYWATIFGVVVSSIVGSWFIPGIITWAKSKSHIRRLYDYHKTIDSLYSDRKLDIDDIKSLDELNRNIGDVYIRGKITDQHYTNLKNEISLLYEEIYKKRIDSLNGKSTDDDNIIRSLTEIKDDVEDDYAKEAGIPSVFEDQKYEPTVGIDLKYRPTTIPYKPTPSEPLVYHLHGISDIPQSMVLTEKDYFDFAISLAKMKPTEALPSWVNKALAGSLLFMGYRLEDITFRVIFQALTAIIDEGLLRPVSVAVQLPPKSLGAAQNYLKLYTKKMFEVDVCWGNLKDFCTALRQQWNNHMRAESK